MCLILCFFFKRATAYEMRISDWSSDVCSSDLQEAFEARLQSLDEGVAHAGITDTLVLDRYRFLELMRDVKLKGHLDGGIHQIQSHVAEPDVGAVHGVCERSEERRGGKECVRTCRSRRSP